MRVTKQVKKFPDSYGTRKFTAVVTRAHHCTLSLANSIQPAHSHPEFFKIHFNIILHLSIGLPSYLLPLGFSTKTLYAFLITP